MNIQYDGPFILKTKLDTNKTMTLQGLMKILCCSKNGVRGAQPRSFWMNPMGCRGHPQAYDTDSQW